MKKYNMTKFILISLIGGVIFGVILKVIDYFIIDYFVDNAIDPVALLKRILGMSWTMLLVALFVPTIMRYCLKTKAEDKKD